MANLRGTTVALRRDLISAHQARDAAVAATTGCDSVASKVKGQLSEIRFHVSDLAGHAGNREAMLKEANSTNNELRAGVKVVNRELAVENKKKIDERKKTATEKIEIPAVEKALQDSENTRELVVAEIYKSKEQL